jgi:hypothetical protein
MSKLARTLALAAMLAAMNLAAMTAIAHAHTSSDPTSTQSTGDAAVRRLLARERSSIPNQAPTQAAADAGHPRLLLDEERSSVLNLPNRAPTQPTSLVQPAASSGQAGWLIPALGGLAAVLAVVAVVAVLAARRAHRSQRASQVA